MVFHMPLPLCAHLSTVGPHTWGTPVRHIVTTQGPWCSVDLLLDLNLLKFKQT